MKNLALYNYTYIRPDRTSETLYDADQSWILNFTAIYMKRRRSGWRAAERHLLEDGQKSGIAT
jgi:hypothetical protein